MGDSRVFPVPALSKGVQSIQCCLLVYGGIDCLQIRHEGSYILIGHIPAGIAQLVEDAVLDLGLREGA